MAIVNGYATITDIRYEYKNAPVFDSSSKPTPEAIERKIEDYSRKIDSIIKNVYTVPITTASNPNSFKVLRQICVSMVRHWLDPLLSVAAEIDADTEEPINLMVKPEKDLKEIVLERRLDDATRLTTNTTGIKDFNHANSIEPTFNPNDKSLSKWTRW